MGSPARHERAAGFYLVASMKILTMTDIGTPAWEGGGWNSTATFRMTSAASRNAITLQVWRSSLGAPHGLGNCHFTLNCTGNWPPWRMSRQGTGWGIGWYRRIYGCITCGLSFLTLQDSFWDLRDHGTDFPEVIP